MCPCHRQFLHISLHIVATFISYSKERKSSMSSIVIPVSPDGDANIIKEKSNKNKFLQCSLNCYLEEQMKKHNMRRIIHSLKVGIALVLASLFYIVDPLYMQVGDNAMWAIMTVVVIFEFSAGATLSKGLNRGLGTILGGGFGCLAAFCAQEAGSIRNSILVGCAVFVFGAAATYSRSMPSIKRRYDYGAMISILTFNLVVVSGARGEKIMEIARDRLATIGMGFVVCISTSFLIFPVWAGDELRYSMASRFENLARSIEGSLEDYFKPSNEKENKRPASSSGCNAVLNSKSQDESLANFARWEPWHGKFGIFHPWDKYLQIGGALRELAALTISLQWCLQSPRKPSPTLRQWIHEPSQIISTSLVWTLRALGESIITMKRYQQRASVESKLQTAMLELSLAASPSVLGELQNEDLLIVANFVFLLGEIAGKVEELTNEVENLGELAGFQIK